LTNGLSNCHFYLSTENVGPLNEHIAPRRIFIRCQQCR